MPNTRSARPSAGRHKPTRAAERKTRKDATPEVVIDPPAPAPPETVVILDEDRRVVSEVPLKGSRAHTISVQLDGREPRSYDHVGFDSAGKWCYAPSDRRTG